MKQPQLTRLLLCGGIVGCVLLCVGLAADARQSSPSTRTSRSDSANITDKSRPPVHPRRNEEVFPTVDAKFVRLRVFKTNVREPCIDELEIYGEAEPTHNLALATHGSKAAASGALAGYEIHQVRWVNDGRYGNMHSWIAEGISNAWVQIELLEATKVNRIVWSRDREGYLIDRLATEYLIEVSANGYDWISVASSADRRPLPAGGSFAGYGPGFRQALLRYSPISSTLSESHQAPWFEYRVDRWQTEEGLPGNEVTSVLQTRDGYLWVGTTAGLARFDGVRFVRFGEREGVRSSGILCLFEDRAGMLWVGTEGGGLLRFEHGRFQALTQRDGLWHEVVRSLAEDASGRLWIGTDAGLDCVRDGKLVRDGSLPARREEPFSRVLCDGGELWAVIGGFLHQVKDGQYLRQNPEGEPASDIAVASMRKGPSGRLWLGGISGRLSVVTNGVTRLGLPLGKLSSDTVLDVCETRGGDVWVGMAATGLRRWRNEQLLSISVPEGLADNSIRCLLEDREGNIWVGTSAGGLHRIKPKKFRLVTTADGLTHNVGLSLAEDEEGVVWVGSNGGGLSAGRRRTGTNSMAAQLPLDMQFDMADVSYLLDNESLPAVLVGRGGVLWLGTWNSGLFRKEGMKVEQFQLTEGESPITALCEDGLGGLWVGTHDRGLKRYEDGTFTDLKAPNGVTARFITTLATDKKGQLWVGTGGAGLNCVFNGTVTRRTTGNGLASDFVRALHPDAEGRLWVGTSGGLSLVRDGKVHTLTTAQGLWDDTISQILEDDQGRLWFGSNRGIFRADKNELQRIAEGSGENLTPVVFGKAEGMESLECTGGYSPAGLKTRDGRLWFSTTKGLVVIDPKRLHVNSIPPNLVIEELRVNGKTVPAVAGEIEIGPGVRQVEFQYSALSLSAPEKVRFRHRLDGVDADWVDAGGRRVAKYPHLSPGRYEFRVRACNEDLLWSSHDSVLVVRCLPAFWETGWFRLLCGLIVFGGCGWGIKWIATRRLRRRLADLRQQHMLEQERIRISRDIHDELGTLLTGISMLSDRSQAHSNEPEKVVHNLRKIGEGARTAVQAVDGIVWAINPHNDTLDHLANYLVQFAEEFFHLTNIRCRLDVPVEVPSVPLSTQQRHHLLMAVKEACNNVVRHSGASEVWVRFQTVHCGFWVTIEDNGRGFQQGTASEGQDGLRNLRQRLAEIGGRLELVSEVGKGTCVKLFTPLDSLKQTS